MTTPTIQKKIARAIEIERIVSTLSDELKEIKTELKEEASSRPDEQAVTDGGGWSWTHADADHNIVCVTQPGRKLKGSFTLDSKTYEKAHELAGKKWSFLFVQVPAYKPIDNFRDLAVAHLGRDAQKLIKAVSSDAPMSVGFEVKKGDA